MKNRSICDQISAPPSRNSRVANATSEENCHEKTKGSLDNTTGGGNTCRAGCYASLCSKSAFLCGHSRFERIVLCLGGSTTSTYKPSARPWALMLPNHAAEVWAVTSCACGPPRKPCRSDRASLFLLFLVVLLPVTGDLGRALCTTSLREPAQVRMRMRAAFLLNK